MFLPGFQELDEDLDLFYRVEPDGSVLISGERTRCIINSKLPDGSRIQGGINNNGLVFGERVVVERGVERRYPLKWQEPLRPAPSGSRLAPKETKRNPLDDPMFDPPSSKRASFQPSFPPPQVAPPVPAEHLSVNAEMLQDLRTSVQQQLTESKQPKPEPKPDRSSRMRRLLSGRKGEEEVVSRTNIEMLSEVAEAIEQTQAEVERVRADNLRAFEQVQSVESENAHLRAELARVREEMKKTFAQQEAEWQRKVQIRRWSIEEVRGQDLVVEGLEARSWEVEDPGGVIRYLVVATIPPGTQEAVVKQWMDDLKARVDLMPFGGGAVYITKHEGARLEVVELVPGVRAEGAEAATQF